MKKKPAVFILMSGLYFNPESMQWRRRCEKLSEKMSGDIVIVENKKRNEPLQIGEFTFRVLTLPEFVSDRNMLRNPVFWAFTIGTMLSQIIKGKRYDAIWASDAFNMGIIAVFLKYITRTPLFIEIMGNLEYATEIGKLNSKAMTVFKSRFIHRAMPMVLNRADSVRLVYPTQINFLGTLKNPEKYSVYPGYVAVDILESNAGQEVNDNYLLLLGGPWYLKGVDVVIEAFNSVAEEYPEMSLKIIGWELEPESFYQKVKYPDRVEFDPHGREYPDVIKALMGCTIFVLGSRTEAYARVLTEARAVGKPIIASAVDGIPTYVEDGKTGLLFERENSSMLADKIRYLLDNPKVANDIAEQGRQYVLNEISEHNYVVNIRASIDSAIEYYGSH